MNVDCFGGREYVCVRQSGKDANNANSKIMIVLDRFICGVLVMTS